jgi:hypothetical protein
MSRIFLCLIIVMSACSTKAQDTLKAFFARKVDSIQSDARKELLQSFTIRAVKNDKLKGAKVEFINAGNDFSVPDADLFFPPNRELEIDNSKDTMEKSFTIRCRRNVEVDRMITLKLIAKDKDGKNIPLKDSNTTYKIWIARAADPLSDANSKGHEFWLFTGTNLDFLDGVKARELYFKGSFLFKLGTAEQNWGYITFGKNRYFSDKDSLFRQRLHDVLFPPAKPDSVRIINGYYDSFREIETNNTFGSIDYLWKLTKNSTATSQLFISTGLYFGLQNIKINYNNFNIVSDTQMIKRTADSVYGVQTLLNETRLTQYNYNASVGILHVLTTDKVNVKTHLLTGLNAFAYPVFTSTRSGVTRTATTTQKNFFFQMKLDATVLDPGIALGFEAFLRRGQQPLFNVSLTKVIDITQLSALFGKLPTVFEK